MKLSPHQAFIPTLILLTICAFIARYNDLSTRDLGGKEDITRNIVTEKSFSNSLACTKITSSPGLYTSLNFGIHQIFNNLSPKVSLRLISVISGTLLVLLIFIKLYYESGIHVALVGGILQSFLYVHIFYSQSARPEVFTSLIAFVSFIFWLDLTRKDDLKTYFLYSLFTVIGLYSYFFYHWIFISQAIILLFLKIKQKESLSQLLAMITSCTTLYMLWFIPNVIHGPLPLEYHWHSIPSIKSILDIFWQYFSSFFLTIFFALLFLKDVILGSIRNDSSYFTENDLRTSYLIGTLISLVFFKSLFFLSSFKLAHFSIIYPLFSYLLARRLRTPFSFPYLGIVFYLFFAYKILYLNKDFYENEGWFQMNSIDEERLKHCPSDKTLSFSNMTLTSTSYSGLPHRVLRAPSPLNKNW